MRQDFREATRFLARHPGFTAVIVLTLGLAIGINSTIFSVLHGVLLRPLAYTQPEQLVGLWESNPAQGLERSQVSAATYLDWRQRARMFKEMGIYRYRGYTLTGTGEPERLVTVDVSPALFRVLAVTPQLGRTFTDAEENPGDDSRKVVLSYGTWVRRFGQDPQVVGKTLTLDDAAHTIVGVMAGDFQFPLTEMQIVMATDADRTAVIRGVKSAMASIDPALPIVKVSNIEDLVSESPSAMRTRRSIQSLLFGVPPPDLLTFVLSALAIIVVGIVAASLPALRASRIDPVGALRSE